MRWGWPFQRLLPGQVWGHLLVLMESSHKASIILQHLTPRSHQQAGKDEGLRDSSQQKF